jgi:hypothetical protein
MAAGEQKKPVIYYTETTGTSGDLVDWTQDRQTPADVIAMPWYRAAGIAAVTGRASGGLVTIDFDRVSDRSLVDTLIMAMGLHPGYRWVVSTPGGGYHLHLLAPGLAEHLFQDDRPDKRGSVKLDRAAINGGAYDEAGRVDNGLPHIEVRYNRVLITLPPSRYAGKQYAFVSGDPDGTPEIVDWRVLLAAYECVTIPPPPRPKQEQEPYSAPRRDGLGEFEEVERRVFEFIANTLVKRGSKDQLYDCPQEHGRKGKDFYFNPETGKVGGCQGKHAGELRRYTDLADFLKPGIVSQIARDVQIEYKSSGLAMARSRSGRR